MHQLEQTIRNKYTLFVGVGNVLKRDDGAGVYITQNIHPSQNIQSLTVEVSIENYIGKINTMHPEVLILVDAMDFNEKPGYWNLLPIHKVRGTTTNTHNITLNKVAELFLSKEIYILGIQPDTIDFGEMMTEKVKQSAQTIIKKINAIEKLKI